MKNDKIKTWQVCAAEVYITRQILNEEFEPFEIYELMTGNWHIEYERDNNALTPNLLKLEINKNLQVFRVPQSFRKTLPEVINNIIETNQTDGKAKDFKSTIWFMITDIGIINGKPEFEYYESAVKEMYSFSPDLIGESSDIPIIQEKLDNCYILLDRMFQKGEIEFGKFVNIDFHNEIYYLL